MPGLGQAQVASSAFGGRAHVIGQRIAPAKLDEASEVAIRAAEFESVLDGLRREMGIHDEARTANRLREQAAEDVRMALRRHGHPDVWACQPQRYLFPDRKSVV